MPYLVLARELAFQPTDPESPTVPVGPEEIVKRGEFVPDYVPAAHVNALSAAGVVVWAEQPSPALVPFGAEPAQVRTPDQPVVLPSDPNGAFPTVADLGGTAEVPVDVEPVYEPEPAQQIPDLPKSSDSKETWENFAQLPVIGMTQGEAEAMNKTDLMAAVKTRYAEATA